MVSNHWKMSILLSLCLILSGCLSRSEIKRSQEEFLRIKNYACYYGEGRVEDLAKYDLVIIGGDHYSNQDVAFLKKNKTIVLGYISLGQDYPLKLGNGTGPGGYASWYLDYFIGEGTENPGKDGQPDKCGDWISYFVNPGDLKWQELTLSRMDELILRGFDGAFLDVVGYLHEYPDDLKEGVLRPGLLGLIKRLRLGYPKAYLVVNGSIFLEEIHNLINGVMCESFSSSEVKHDEEVLAVTVEGANRINKIRNYPENPNLIVLALDYVGRGDIDLVTFDYKRALSFGFIPNISYDDSYLTDLCLVNPANRFLAKREKDGVLLTWEAPAEFIEESLLSHYIIKRGSKPILSETDFKEAFLVNDKVSANITTFKDSGAPKTVLYYTLVAVNRGGIELVGRLTTCVKEE
ncbi:TPA: hypothetical protein DCX15_03860 [bacterium]|nr:hypothetical protein [bacterium]